MNTNSIKENEKFDFLLNIIRNNGIDATTAPYHFFGMVRMKILFDDINWEITQEEYSRLHQKLLDEKIIDVDKQNRTGFKLTYDGDALINKHGSYSSYLKYQKRKITFEHIKSCIILLSIIWGGVFTYLNYNSNQENNELKKENKQLNYKIDSLEILLENK